MQTTIERFDLTTTEHTAASMLGNVLQVQNYAQLYRHVAEDSLVASDHRYAQSMVRQLPAQERSFMELFALGAWTKVTPEISDLTKALVDAHLIEYESDTDLMRTCGWVIVPVLGGYVMTGTPANYHTSHSIGASAYIGHDSILLAASLGDPRGRRILDLGCGCGLQGLLGARGASEVVLTDIDEFSLLMTRLNAVINNVEHPVSIRHGAFYEPVVGECFDTILVLPPYVPSVEGSATSLTVDGGPDGLAFIRQLLQGASAHLSSGGELLAICQMLCDDRGPLLLDELEDLCPELEVRISTTNWHPLQPYALELSTRLAAHGANIDMPTLLDRYLTSLRSFGATGVCTADIRARHTSVTPQPTPHIVGNIPAVSASMVPITTEAGSITSLGDVATLTHQGSQIVLNGPTAALLCATDGTTNIEDIATIAWGLPNISTNERQRTDLIDQAIERFMELERLGVVSLDRR